MATSNTGIQLKEKIQENYVLASKKWKGLVIRTHKTVQKDHGTTLIRSMVAKILQKSAFLKRFSSALRCYNLARTSPIHLIRMSFGSAFDLFSAGGAVSQ